jgi:hypothetical protein
VQRLFLHIERLLLLNDCVIIPELGGFVLHPVPAIYSPVDHKFCPPQKSIIFHPSLNHYDRLIPESYMQIYGMSFEEAHYSFRKDVECLCSQLDKEGWVGFDQIGFMKKGDDGNLFFEAEHDSTFVGLKPFGLYTFHLPPVVSDVLKAKTDAQNIPLPSSNPSAVNQSANLLPGILQKATTGSRREAKSGLEHKSKPKQIAYLTVKRSFVRVVGISAAAVALYFIVSTPVNETNRNSYSAGINSAEMFSVNVCKPALQEGLTPESTLMIEEVNQVSSDEAEKTADPPAATQLQPAVRTVGEAKQKTHYAIIASFASEIHANQFIQEIQMPELTNMGMVKNEARVRVYADKFDTKDEAQNYILRLRENKKLKDTWLFSQ